MHFVIKSFNCCQALIDPHWQLACVVCRDSYCKFPIVGRTRNLAIIIYIYICILSLIAIWRNTSKCCTPTTTSKIHHAASCVFICHHFSYLFLDISHINCSISFTSHNYFFYFSFCPIVKKEAAVRVSILIYLKHWPVGVLFWEHSPK